MPDFEIFDVVAVFVTLGGGIGSRETVRQGIISLMLAASASRRCSAGALKHITPANIAEIEKKVAPWRRAPEGVVQAFGRGLKKEVKEMPRSIFGKVNTNWRCGTSWQTEAAIH
jgi:hypothetical protein